ncbi:Tripartite tricarboxylate transporter family receptor [compost metagenome]
MINPALKQSLPYDARKAFDPVALLAISPNLVLVNSGLNIKTFADLKAYGKSHSSIPFGTAGIGGAPHIVGELLRAQSGLPLVHVAYKGAGPAMGDLVSGQVPFGIAESVTANAYLKSGKIIPLAIASAQRSTQFPTVPTLNELGYKGFDLTTWVGVYAPAGTPAQVLDVLNRGIRKALSRKATTDYIRSTGSEPGDMDLPTYRAFVLSEMDKWKGVVQQAGVKDE